MQSPAAHTPLTDVAIDSSTMKPPALPTDRPAAAPSSVLGSLCVATTSSWQAISPSEVRTARTAPFSSPRISSSLLLKCRVAPISRHESSTGATMSGSVAMDSVHGLGSTRWVSMLRWHSAVTISSPSGPASSTTALVTLSSTLSHSMASRMFFM